MNSSIKGFCFFFVFFVTPLSLIACPLCIGKVVKSSPPFFSDEFYQPQPKQDMALDLITTGTK